MFGEDYQEQAMSLNQQDLAFAFGLTPDEALKFLQKKVNKPSWNWYDMRAEAHAKAFTVAKATKLEVLSSIHQAVNEAMEQGLSEAEFKKRLRPKLQSLGWWGNQEKIDTATGEVLPYKVNNWRLRTIYRTNMQVAYSAGHYKAQVENSKYAPYWQYVALLDGRTRDAHAIMHGLVFRFDDPIWLSHYPPNGFNCRCSVSAHSQDYIDEHKLKVQNSQGNLKPIEQLAGKQGRNPVLKQGVSYTLPKELQRIDKKGNLITGFTPDVGWSINAGNRYYVPDLSNKPPLIATALVKDILIGPAFARWFDSANHEVKQLSTQHANLTGAELKSTVRNELAIPQTWPVGILSQDLQQALGSQNATVLLSDDTLGKQLVSRQGQDFGLKEYQGLQEVIEEADSVWLSEDGRLHFIKVVNDRKLYAILKTTSLKDENYVVSYRRALSKEVVKMSEDMRKIK